MGLDQWSIPTSPRLVSCDALEGDVASNLNVAALVMRISLSEFTFWARHCAL